MSEETPPLAERFALSYKRLASSAEKLGTATEEFSAPIPEIDKALQELNLGVVAWETFASDDDPVTHEWWTREVGYKKVASKWGLAIRERRGHHAYPDQDDVDVWAFNDAPRSFRIAALDKVPDLLEALIKASDKTAKKLRTKATDARALADAAKAAALELKRERKERRP